MLNNNLLIMNKIHTKATKRCRICGDVASGFNYNGMSCESCKIFFLRNAHDKLQCVGMGKCVIDISKRKNCAKCRLQKCFENEMLLPFRKTNKNLILQQNNTEHLLQEYIQKCIGNFDDFNEANLVVSIQPQIPSCSFTQRKRFATELVPRERSLIHDMQSMFSDKFVDERQLKIVGKIDDVFGAFNFTESYGRRIVKFCKCLPAFTSLNDADQLVLFKSFYMGILGIRLSFLRDDKRDGFPVIANETGNEALFFCFENSILSMDQKMLNDNKILQRQLWIEMENDFTIRDLLIALFLFQQKENLKCRETVGYQYFVYSRLLRRYLEHKYRNIKKANKKFVKLCSLAEQMTKLKDGAQIVLSELDSSAISPLVRELFE